MPRAPREKPPGPIPAAAGIAGAAAAVAGAAGWAAGAAPRAWAAGGLAAGVAAGIGAGLALLPAWAKARGLGAEAARLREGREEERRAEAAERRALSDALAAAREEVARARRARDEFVAIVSHELRTPLNTVLGWARLLRLGKLGPAAAARAVETIERSASSQARIVDDLLDVSRIARGQLRLDVRPVELAPVVEAALEAVRPAASARGVALEAALEPGAGPVVGDAGRLQQVVWNLLSNAIKFTPAGGRVDVHVERRGEAVELVVKDTGAGIAPAFLPHLFERFRQADSSSTRSHGGLGVGLAIVRDLVEAHGGTVSAESGGVGTGSTFAVRLPVAAWHAEAAADATPRGGRPGALSSLARLRVLVVDDDADTVEVVRQVLEQAGADVVAAGSAREALDQLAARPPDVLLSDLGMPGVDGYALIRRVRGLDPARGGRVPAAALTARIEAEDRREALTAGYQVYLSKPIEPAELTAAVARLAGRAA